MTVTTTEAEGDVGVTRREVARGAIWAGVNNIVMRLASIVVTAIVARLLSPDDFGVFAVALAVHAVVTSLAELGMASAIARSPMEPEDIAGTVTSIAVGVSLGLAAVMALTAPWIAVAVGVPDAAEPIRILAITLALTGVFAVPGAQLTREFRQDRIFVAQVSGFVPANVVLILLAATVGGANAFAWSRVVGQVATGLVYVASVSRLYRPAWRRQLVGSLLRFGLPLSIANLVNWSLLNADYLILGRLVDESRIGVYMIAFSVANWSTAVLGSVLNGVVVPSFGRVAHDRARLRELLSSSVGLVALVAMPIAAVSAVLAHDIVGTVFGSKWLDAAPVLVVLATYGLLFAFSLLLANVLVATGATTRLLLVQVAWIAALVPAMVVGIRMDGLVGAAWAHVVVIVAIAIPGYVWAVVSVVNGVPRGWLRPLLRPAVAAAGAAAVAFAVSRVIPSSVGGLLAGGLASVLVYSSLAWPAIVAAAPGVRRISTRFARSASPERLRIAVVLEGLALGGCPINAIDLARELRGRGHTVYLHAVDEDVKVSLLPYAAASGFEVARFPGGAGPVSRARALRASLGGNRYDIVHAYAPWLGPATTLACGLRSRPAPVVLNWNMEHMPHTGPRTPLILGTERLCEIARRDHGAAVWLLEPPVDQAKDHPDERAAHEFRAEYGVADGDILLVLVGRVDRVMKLPGILAAIRAVEILDDPRVRLAVVGDGNAFDEVAAEARLVNQRLEREAVVLTGSLLDPHAAYSAADIGIGMGGSALRALAHGSPVVVQGDRGFAEVVGPETEAHFLTEGFFGEDAVADPAGHLATRLRPLLDPEARRRAAGFGLALVERRFSLVAGADRLEEIYSRSLLDTPGPVGRLVDAVRIVARDAARRARPRRRTGGDA